MFRIAINKYLEEHGFEAFHPKAVLFDMDGVLYDSMPNHAIAWQESMAKFGIHMTADDAYATEGARGVDTIRQMALQQLHREIDEAEAQRMYDVKSETFHSLPEAPVMPGILSLMAQIDACGISGNILGVNPFNQPGVEAYKKNMFALLGKPGYEAESEAIKARL